MSTNTRWTIDGGATPRTWAEFEAVAAGIDIARVRRATANARRIGARFEASAAAARELRAAAPAPTLPECAGFTGPGQRCESCRVHRRTHD